VCSICGQPDNGTLLTVTSNSLLTEPLWRSHRVSHFTAAHGSGRLLTRWRQIERQRHAVSLILRCEIQCCHPPHSFQSVSLKQMWPPPVAVWWISVSGVTAGGSWHWTTQQCIDKTDNADTASNCDVIKDGASNSLRLVDHLQTTSKAAVSCGGLSQGCPAAAGHPGSGNYALHVTLPCEKCHARIDAGLKNRVLHHANWISRCSVHT